jgi:hypothetical protein
VAPIEVVGASPLLLWMATTEAGGVGDGRKFPHCKLRLPAGLVVVEALLVKRLFGVFRNFYKNIEINFLEKINFLAFYKILIYSFIIFFTPDSIQKPFRPNPLRPDPLRPGHISSMTHLLQIPFKNNSWTKKQLGKRNGCQRSCDSKRKMAT